MVLPDPIEHDSHETEPDELETLFDEALELEIPARRDLVRVVSSRNPVLARELESLLAADESAGSFLSAPPSLEGLSFDELEQPEAISKSPAQLVGLTFGDFVLLRHLGSGGGSDVFEAQQERPRRVVAVKVLRDGLTSPDVRARFLHEAEALARLEHPSVARVFGAGTAQGPAGDRPWIAVELIPEPRTIQCYATERALDRIERVRLFVPLCDAVAHAHQKGLLHRDLKPANLLIARSGESPPKVIDFGLARWLDPLDREEQERTRAGELLGTLRYMSPEQCAGDAHALDVRTDVYALGVVLYELLTGELPYVLEDHSLLQVLTAIREHEPAPAGLDPDLDAILARALSKHPEDRYDSVQGLRADLEHWLANEPVVARRPSLSHRLRLFARRRTRTFVAILAGGLAASAALATIATLFFANRAALERVRAAERRATTHEVQMATARADLARLQDRLDGLLVESPPTQNAELAERLVVGAETRSNQATTANERRTIVAEAIGGLRLLMPQLEDDDRSLTSLAHAFTKIGDLHGSDWMATAEDARMGLEAYRESARLWRRVVARTDSGANRGARAELTRVLILLAQAQRKVGASEAGRPFADEAIALARQSVDEQPTEAAAIEQLIEALWARGDMHIALAPPEQGLVDSREAYEWCLRLEANPGSEDAAGFFAWTLLRLGIWTLRLENEPAPALELFVEMNDRLMADLEANQTAGRTERVAERADRLFTVFVWNELALLLQESSSAEAVQRLSRWVDLALELEPHHAIVLPTASLLGAHMLDQLDTVAERARLEERLFDSWEALSAEVRATTLATTEEYLDLDEHLGPHGLGWLEDLRRR